MSTYVKLDENNIVVSIVEIDANNIEIFNTSKYVLIDNTTRFDFGYTYNELTGRFIPPQPYPSWHLVADKWVAPEINNLRNEFYNYAKENSHTSSYWNEDRQMWASLWSQSFFDQENTRDRGFFFVYKCRDVKEYSKIQEFIPGFSVKCDPDAYDYHEVHPEWVEGYVEPLFAENGYGHEFGANIGNPNHNYIYDAFRVVYDGAPYFRIMYGQFVNLNKPDGKGHYEPAPELEEIHLKQHPQLAARSLGELFRLIIDWDFAKHHYNNNENIANLAHNVLGAMNMPENIYQTIIDNFKPSPIVRYLQGDINCLELGERQLTPPELIEYFKDKYYDFRHLKTHEIPNVNSVNENHYHI